MSSILILGTLAVLLSVVAYFRGGWELPAQGFRAGFDMLVTVAPQLVIGFALAGLVTVMLPREALSGFVGADSGVGGVVIATAAGIVTPGGPFLQFPLVAALASSGAAPGPLAAYLTAWSLLGWHRIVIWELPLLGTSFTLSRFLVSLSLPLLVGFVAPVVLRLLEKPTSP